MLNRLVFATNNENKCREARAILPAGFELLTLNDIGCKADIAETGDTFAENARIKCEYVRDHYGLDCFSDDSGLEVDALYGAPGVYSARYARREGSLLDNLELLMQRMAGETNRCARFKTVVCLMAAGAEHFLEGTIEGKIALAPAGTNGFGYDPVFIPDGYNCTFAELSATEKNSISHRGKAMRKLVEYLSTHYSY